MSIPLLCICPNCGEYARITLENEISFCFYCSEEIHFAELNLPTFVCDFLANYFDEKINDQLNNEA